MKIVTKEWNNRELEFKKGDRSGQANTKQFKVNKNHLPILNSSNNNN